MHGGPVAEAEQVNMPVLEIHSRNSEGNMQAFRVGAKRLNKGGQGAQSLLKGQSGLFQQCPREVATAYRSKILVVVGLILKR